MEIINGKVYKDFRNNILFDKNNPVLAMKANRDRYTKMNKNDIYSGLPQIGSRFSEDALTWNIFREIIPRNGLSSIEKLLNIKLINPKLLLWTLSFSNECNDLQYIVGNYIRSIDGKINGQITEPDIIIVTDDYFIVIECKLGEKDKYPKHLWESNSENGPQKRYDDYFSKHYFLTDDNTKLLYETKCYQLFRMVFYTIEIAKYLHKKSIFLSLTNKTWLHIKRNGITPMDIFDDFCKSIIEDICIKNITWQDLIFDDVDLKKCINDNVCL
jgi:hypothetical protein